MKSILMALCLFVAPAIGALVQIEQTGNFLTHSVNNIDCDLTGDGVSELWSLASFDEQAMYLLLEPSIDDEWIPGDEVSLSMDGISRSWNGALDADLSGGGTKTGLLFAFDFSDAAWFGASGPTRGLLEIETSTLDGMNTIAITRLIYDDEDPTGANLPSASVGDLADARPASELPLYEVAQEWVNIPLSQTYEGKLNITFEATPNADSMNGVIGVGLADSSWYDTLAAIVRFNPDGYIDARNGDVYFADVDYPYTEGTSCHFDLWIDLETKTYSVTVTQTGGSPTVVASDYAFRTEMAGASALATLSAVAVTDSFSINEISESAGVAADWVNVPLSEPYDGLLTVGFTATPGADGMDGVIGIGLADSTWYDTLAAIVRFNRDGNIDARNGEIYSADVEYPYSEGVAYHFDLWIDLAAGTYSVTVAQTGKLQTVIASDYAFRTEMAGATALATLSAVAVTDSFLITNLSEAFGNFRFTASEGAVAVTGYVAPPDGFLEIPAVINGKPVTSIGNNAFYRCYRLTEITIPSSVTSIGDSAFYNCDRLTEITIPPSVISIGTAAFANSGELTDVRISSGVTSIGDFAFYSCSGLKRVTLPSGLISIGNRAFAHCGRLTYITIPSSVTSIGDFAFYDCYGLESAIFMGDAPEADSSSFPYVTLYYFNTASGFSDPPWDGYPSVNMGAYSLIPPWLLSHGFPHDEDLLSAPHHDGVSFLMAYALNLDLSSSQVVNLPKPTIESNQMCLTFHGGRETIRYSVQVSSDLRHWTSTGVTVSGPDANGHCTASYPVSDTQCYMRLVVSE